MKQFEFSTLRVFAAVARSGSLSAAAEQLHLAVTAISKRIVDLEAEAGAKLLRRHGRGGVTLTPAGQTLYQHAQQLLFGVERMRAELSEFSQGVEGHVRLAAISSAVTQYLPTELKAFAAAHPRTRIDLRELITHECLDALRDGLVEIAIVAAGADLSGLEVLPYRSDRLCMIAPRGHPAARGKDISLERALHWDFIGLNANSSLMALLGLHANGRMRLRVQVMSFGAVGEMVRAGFGVGVMPEHAARMQARMLGLKAVPLSDPWALRQMLICVRSVETLTASARDLLGALTQASGNDAAPPSKLHAA